LSGATPGWAFLINRTMAMPNPPSAAASIYPHLKSDEPPKQAQRAQQSLSAAMWPSLGPQPKPPTNPHRESLLRHLREANAAIDARLAREGKR
jgi:hypothetical protein